MTIDIVFIQMLRIKQAVKEMEAVTPIFEMFLEERNISKNEIARMSDTQLRMLHASYMLYHYCLGKQTLIPYYLFKAVCENDPNVYYPDVSSYRTEEEIIKDYAEYIKTYTIETENSHIRFRLTIPKFYKHFYGEMHVPEIRPNWVGLLKKYLRLGNITCGGHKKFECLLYRQWKPTHDSCEGEEEYWRNKKITRIEEM